MLCVRVKLHIPECATATNREYVVKGVWSIDADKTETTIEFENVDAKGSFTFKNIDIETIEYIIA